MKHKLPLILLVAGSPLFAISPATAADLYWSGDGTEQGGAGTWDTTSANWGAVADGPFGTVWENSNNDTAIFGSTAGAVTLGADVTVGGLSFGTNSYSIAAGAGPYSITFGTAGDIAVTTGTTTIFAPIVSSHDITKTGTGTLVLNVLSPDFTGNLTISGGTLRVGNNNTTALLGGATYAGNIENNGILWFTHNQNQTLSGVISGTGILNKGGSNTLTLTGANTYTGRTIIAGSGQGGPILSISSFNSVNADETGAVMASSSLGAPTTHANATIQLGANNNIRSCTIIYTGSGETTNRIMNVQFNSSAARTITNNGTGLLNFTSNFTITPSSGTDQGRLRLNGSGDGQIAQIGAIPTILEKADAGTWTIGGTNSANSVQVNGGTLVVNGTLATTDTTVGPNTFPAGAITVAASATLAGEATLGADVNVTGSLSPGIDGGVGSLTINGDLNMAPMAAGAAVVNMDLGPIAASDQITVNGDLNIGSDVLGIGDFDFTDVGGLEEGIYTLITSAGIIGSLDGDALQGTIGSTEITLGTSGNNIILTVGTPAGGSPFDTWADTGTLGPVSFDGDTNGDGVPDGLAFLLGAANPDDNALGLLPTATETNDGLVLSFNMLKPANRGTATLSVEHSRDLGIADPWTTVLVTDADSGPANGVTFVVGTGAGTTNPVTATISASEAGGTGKLFGRLKGQE